MCLTTKFAPQWLTETQTNRVAVGMYNTAMAYKTNQGAYDFVVGKNITQMGTSSTSYEVARQNMALDAVREGKGRAVPNVVLTCPSEHYQDHTTIVYFGEATVPTDTRPAIWSFRMEIPNEGVQEIMNAIQAQPAVVEEMFQLSPFGSLTRPNGDGQPQLQRHPTDALLMIRTAARGQGVDGPSPAKVADYLNYYLGNHWGEPLPAPGTAVPVVMGAEFGRTVGEQPTPAVPDHGSRGR
jgi:hypothetical protein